MDTLTAMGRSTASPRHIGGAHAARLQSFRGERPRRWVWFLLALPFGLTTWAMYLYLGLRTGGRKWFTLAAVVGAAMILGFIFTAQGNQNSNSTINNIGVAMILGVWIGGIAHATVIWSLKLDGISDALAAAERERNDRRAYGRRLLSKQAAFARELGGGRPDLPEADHCFLVDFNHVPEQTLAGLQWVGPELAHRIVQYRQDVGPFSSLDDMDVTLDLPPALTDDLKNVAVFLPD